MKRSNLFLFLAAGVACTFNSINATAAEKRPNVIVILADDVGFSDLGCYGGEVDTPNLDSLAKGGLRFTQFYNTARCCPTRASLLTGLYPHQAGMGHMTQDNGFPGYQGDLNKECATIAEVLRDSDYRTYALGKWHIARNARANGPQHNWPLQRGFDKYYGTIWGAASYFDPGICRGNTWYSRENDPEYKVDDYYFTTALSDNAVMFLQQHEKESKEKPFFMYVAFTAAHWPLMAQEKDIAKYKGRFDAGYDKLRKERLARMRKMGIIDAKWGMTPTVGQWDQVKNKEWELRCMEVYAAMLDSMDQGIGKILAELKRQGTFDNTLVMFMQDNGACAEEIGRKPRKPADAKNLQPLRANQLPNGGSPPQTREGKPMRSGPGAMPGPADVYLGYGEKWANVSNTPFREYKHWVHEGGIATPLIAHWPKGIGKDRADKFVTEPSHLIDIMATCVDVAQTSYPAERNGQKIKPLQGVSLRPTFEEKETGRKEPIFWEHEGNRAVRDGKWKLVAKENKPWELFDMDADRTEMQNLAEKEPERVKTMAAQWDAYAARADVLPLGGWKGPGRRAKASNKEKSGKNLKSLEAGQVLSAEESPVVAESPITVSVEITNPKGDGVLVAQGGTVHGYAFYIKDGRLSFDLRRNSEISTLTATEEVGDTATTVSAILGQKGRLRLIQGNREVAAKADAGLLSTTPVDGLSAGHDAGDAVGEYSGPFTYEGKLGQITVETQGQ